MVRFANRVGVVVAFGIASSGVPADIIYVDDSAAGANNGTSWQDAYIDLQDALSAAQAGAEIRVGQGMYKPDGPGGSVDATFAIVDVIVHGGFAGVGAVDPDANDPATFITTLSADLNGNDPPGPPTMTAPFTDNVHHVVTISNSTSGAQLIGVVVTHGIAVGSHTSLDGQGAGIINVAGNATMSNCRVAENLASGGGGMCNRDGASPTMTQCAFVDNRMVAGYYGGAIYNLDSTPTTTDCEFTGNGSSACFGVGQGGAMYNKGSDVHVTNCTFTTSRAGTGAAIHNDMASDGTFDGCAFQDNCGEGGGAMANTGSSPTVTNCTFISNDGEAGAAVFNSASTAHFENCLFQENHSILFGGGGMYNNTSHPTVISCLFRQNTANSITGVGLGGGMWNEDASSPAVINCEFLGNIAQHGGGMTNSDTSSPTLVNCTFAGNQSDGILCFATAAPTLRNCILWGNTPTALVAPASASVTYSDVEGGWPGTGNINVDPQMENPLAGDLQLLPGSPCIDAADNSAVPAGVTTDLAANPRFVDDPATADTGNGTPPVVDMGAFEFQGPAQKCGADISPDGGDGIVDQSDLQMIIDNWGQTGGNPADITGDGIVNTADLLAAINSWGPCR